MSTILFVIALVLGCLSTLMSILLLVRFRWSTGGAVLWGVKSYSSALAPFWGAAGGLCTFAGIATGSWVAMLIGGYSAVIFFGYWFRIAAMPDPASGFPRAFGWDWEGRIPAAQKMRFLKGPGVLRLPAAGDVVFRQDITYATVPGTSRTLLCDLWLPPKGVAHSGLAFIYLHGGAWFLLDKDFGTRPFFSHLAGQGHVVMDVAFRLYPETDMTGMVQDAKRAIAWIKANAHAWGVDPDSITIGGGSSGGHIALLAAYLPDEPKLVPPELAGVDLSVRAVVATYGPPDLAALYYHMDQHLTTRPRPGGTKKTVPVGTPRWLQKRMGKDYHRLGYDKPSADAGALGVILGCHPDQCPQTYEWFSPIAHVHRGCPPTLIIQGERDMFTPVEAARRLYKKLTDALVPTVMHLLPLTDHGFDLFVPRWSPVAHTAVYDIERFLALVMSTSGEEEWEVQYRTAPGVSSG